MKKYSLLLVFAGVILAAAPYQSYASASDYGPGWALWEKDDIGWWYRNPDGSYTVSDWQEIKGSWYHFDDRGYMQTGILQEQEQTYYLDDDGVMVSDMTIEINGISYSFGSDGVAEIRFKEPVALPAEAEKTDLMRTNDAMADQILAGIINPNMNERQKATAIYQWVRGHLTYSYSASSTIGDWHQSANEGLRRRRGHCYTYYATSLQLLSRAGFTTIEVIRSKDNDHWWNMVYVDGNWYHFDTTPRSAGGTFCLLTTAELMSYSTKHNNSHVFDASLYPATP